MTFSESTLADVCSVITDGAHNSPKSVEDGGLPMASVKDLWPWGIDFSTCRHISKADFEVLVRQGCKPKMGDVLIAKDGATALDTVCVVKSEEEVVLLSSVAILRPDPRKIQSNFLRYFLEDPSTKSFMKGGLITGAAIPRVVLKDFKRCPIRVPDLKSQEATSFIISAYDDLIENNIRRIKILEQMAQMVYREWFVNFRFPGNEKVEMVESKIGTIPTGWSIGSFGDLMTLKSGYPFKSETFEPDGDFGLVTIRNVHDGNFSPECQSRIAVPPSNLPSFCRLHAGDVLMSLTGNVARTCIIYGHNLLLNQRVAKVVGRRALDLPYLYCLLRAPEARTRLEQISTGVAQQNLSPVKALEEKLLIPDEKLREAFSVQSQPLLNLIVNLFVRNDVLRRTRDFLLPKLISGEVSVETLEEEALAETV